MNDIEWCFVKSAFILVVGLMKIAERQTEAFFLNCQSISYHQLFTNYDVPLDFAAQNNNLCYFRFLGLYWFGQVSNQSETKILTFERRTR